MTVEEVVLDALHRLGIAESEVSNEARLQDDLELDSTETVEIALALRREFEIDLAAKIQLSMTLGQVYDLARSTLAQRGAPV
jgi:acyl carrier protein